jgi:hypothetical protein
MNAETQKVDVLEVLKDAIKRTSPTSHFNERANLWATHDAVAELMAAAEDARYALLSCIDALSSDEQSDHDALARVTAALAGSGAKS